MAASHVQLLLSKPIPWSQDDLQGLAVAGYESFDPRSLPWSEASTGLALPDGFRLTKKSGHRWVLSFEWRGERLYAKRGVPRLIRQRVSWTLRGSKAQREFAIGRAFAAAGVLVPEPVFYAHTKSSESYLVTRALPDSWMSYVDWVRTNGIVEGDLTEAARFARWLHGLSAFHADFRADHIFRTDAVAGSPSHEAFALIDLDGSQVGRAPSARLRAIALYQLFLSLVPLGMTRDHAIRFCRAYAPKSSDRDRLDPNAIYDRVEKSWKKISARRKG